jgi:hypothetical protein
VQARGSPSARSSNSRHQLRRAVLAVLVAALVERYVSTYLLTSRVPPKGTVCRPDVVPSAEAAAAQTQRAAGTSSRAAVIPPLVRLLMER